MRHSAALIGASLLLAGTAGGADFETTKKSCDKGSAADCYLTAGMYRTGTGVGQDAGKAAKYFEKGCDLKDAQSCLELAGMHRKGEGVKVSVDDALEYLGRACTAGSGQLRSVLMPKKPIARSNKARSA